MDSLNIEGQELTPEVLFDKQTGIFKISGKSLHEDTPDFFNKVYSWLHAYVKDPNEHTSIDIKIEYFNSSSQKAIHEVFEILNRIDKVGKKITINWHYLESDEDMHESGQDFQDLSGLNFNFISYTLE